MSGRCDPVGSLQSQFQFMVKLVQKDPQHARLEISKYLDRDVFPKKLTQQILRICSSDPAHFPQRVQQAIQRVYPKVKLCHPQPEKYAEFMRFWLPIRIFLLLNLSDAKTNAKVYARINAEIREYCRHMQPVNGFSELTKLAEPSMGWSAFLTIALIPPERWVIKNLMAVFPFNSWVALFERLAPHSLERAGNFFNPDEVLILKKAMEVGESNIVKLLEIVAEKQNSYRGLFSDGNLKA
jgi:hypothetical protein